MFSPLLKVHRFDGRNLTFWIDILPPLFIILTVIVLIYDTVLLHESTAQEPLRERLLRHMEVVLAITLPITFLFFLIPRYRLWFLDRNPHLRDVL